MDITKAPETVTRLPKLPANASVTAIVLDAFEKQTNKNGNAVIFEFEVVDGTGAPKGFQFSHYIGLDDPRRISFGKNYAIAEALGVCKTIMGKEEATQKEVDEFLSGAAKGMQVRVTAALKEGVKTKTGEPVSNLQFGTLPNSLESIVSMREKISGQAL